MATRKTSRAPQQASLFDDLVTDTPAGSPSSTAAAPAAPATDPTSAAPAATPGDIQHLAAQFDALPAAWREVLAPFVASDAYGPLCRFVDSERAAGKTVYPTDVFRALRLTSPDDVKVVILGQDPYHGDDRGTPQAHGLAFSVPPAVKPPPSLRNIFKEIAANFGHDTPRHGCLDSWARQGVLLLNTVLTVERGAAASHAKRGWEQCTDTLIHELANRHRGLVFMLWGAHAQAKRALFDANAHCVLEAPHPSPLSAHRGFLGCRHFALANDYLAAHDRAPIDWRLPDEAETFA
ncbi:uracil-DNA glycosylase [Burkholderia ubonensis]|uniref:Uracil-DNA glycosylase n=1 Tax=Burkholderia ubonensis TaxID=101571 RepID=A0AAW3N2I6_9BURK|nr:uracil-DNA glycosylase [Burkholderia ubonensis]KVM16137.1 uracil-DNA glycosylase [Burkholderia ubonensis]KVM19398.1 uracil-DNA glycosylase [Burkholderia ubonensis]KVM53382.1 uracil-DNA glycosylase [Burkholderia ubonensis]KVQ02463.1 uracil-DNA glycosylase [Burkholderia ubonensis]KVR28502.1 uracil-DNA glycosylase [Burkholderia ubonensis]